ncbi:hypothetical protein [Sinorhizobium meliloti]|uniref:hypothetical protein n=1 Tax=Rhizobium meliloti TaxID=382 RepID=UPI0004F5AF16|nr:hypothetical protein [Sinorhizobium meliloti]AIL98348.1 hypothetical protein DU99_02645 [Sinorhizobium meliloti]MDW9616974.1 hypothetical protein [Sinorhizobium meliloti]RVE83283.1 hypothetical protein CN240_09980 [Sinorhizobium meliloti]RVG45200.1 hypothetical protein CN227_15830 [Sinorhizobium meliloti]RVO96485.1 hypothetical protein CN089_08400 [Sinorhizobium meliloti]
MSEPEHDPDWDSPEAIAKWRVRGIRNIHERAKEFHRIRAELEMEISTAHETLVRKPLMREDEIEAAAKRAYDALQERKAKDQG